MSEPEETETTQTYVFGPDGLVSTDGADDPAGPFEGAWVPPDGAWVPPDVGLVSTIGPDLAIPDPPDLAIPDPAVGLARPLLFKPMAQRKAENPEAYKRYERAADAVAVARAEAEPVSLSLLLGGPGQSVTREGVTFVPKSPKLIVLDEMFAAVSEMTGEESAGKRFAGIARVLTYILHVTPEGEPNGLAESGPALMRRATFEEIANCFELADMELLNGLMARYSGLKQVTAAEGNASTLPTTPI